MATRRPIESQEGWEIIQKGIAKLINILEGIPEESPMDADYWVKLFTAVFTMGFPGPLNYPKELYDRYKGVFDDYLTSKVLPAIQEKQQDDVSMLQEFVKRWANHKVMITKFCKFFDILDRHYLPQKSLPSLKDVGFGCFREIVYGEMKVKVKDAVIALINQEREGNEIDRSLVKDVVEIFVEIGNEKGEDNLDCYVNDFETAFLADTAEYYTRKGSNGITAVECLQMEKDKVSYYLHSSTVEKLLIQVQGPPE